MSPARYWSPARELLVVRDIEQLTAIHDPRGGDTHMLSDYHMAVLSCLPTSADAALALDEVVAAFNALSHPRDEEGDAPQASTDQPQHDQQAQRQAAAKILSGLMERGLAERRDD